MRGKKTLWTALGIGLCLLCLFLAADSIMRIAKYLSPGTGNSLENGALIYAAECASCHGENLGGQIDWKAQNEDGTMRAPPHNDTGHTWHHPDKFLFEYTKFGGSEMLQQLGVKDVKSGMPGYSDRLTDQEIWDVLKFIKSSWSEKSRKYQEKRSAKAQE